MTFTAADKLKCADRETKQRQSVYARRVSLGKMTQAQAEREIALMSEIASDYRRQAEGERLL